MSLVIKNEESFYEMLWKYSVELIEITSIFKFVAAVGFIIVISCIFYRFHGSHISNFQTPFSKCRYKRLTNVSNYAFTESQIIKNYTRSVVRCQSIISHKEMFNILEHAANRCSEKYYALKCIDIVVYCPQLLNMRSPLSDLTPFHRICSQAHTYLITFMLAKGADPFLTTIRGENALCMAVYHFLKNPAKDDFSCLELLLQTGCEFGLKNKWYNILLKMAFDNNHLKLAQWFILHHKVPSNKILRCSSTPPVLKNHKCNI